MTRGAPGEMWNSNSLTEWLLARSGHDTDTRSVRPPARGRALGWAARLIVAGREETTVDETPMQTSLWASLKKDDGACG